MPFGVNMINVILMIPRYASSDPSDQRTNHLAGQSHVGLSFEIPESTCDEVAMGTLSLLELCRDLEEPIRIYLAFMFATLLSLLSIVAVSR